MAYERTWDGRPARARSAADAARESYYGVPPIHPPHWKWLVVTYFYLGGLAAGSYVASSIAELVGGQGARRIVRAGRYLSLAALLPCPPLLILDLGRPERFLYMLRVLKLRSPMSAGVWGLLAFSGFCGLSAMTQAARDGLLGGGVAARLLLRVPSKLLGVLGMGPAFFLGSYTGVLLAATAVPLWTRSHLLIGPLFLTSAVSNATAAIALVLSLARGTRLETLERLERLDGFALLADLGLLAALRVHLGPSLARPLETGRLGWLFRGGVVAAGLLAPLGLHWTFAVRNRTPRGATSLASALVLLGGFLLRYTMIAAGRASALDPRATFELAAPGAAQAGGLTAGGSGAPRPG